MTISKALSASMLLVLGSLCASGDTRSQERPAAYVRVTPADIKWNPLPSLPKGAQIAVLHGNPGKPGLFTLRIKLPVNFKLPVHSHPDERVRTIVSGTYYSAVGDRADPASLIAFPVGTFSHVPPQLWQFAETRDEEVVFQITGIGPTGIDYLDPADDPRKK